MEVAMTVIVITRIKCEKKHGPQIKLAVAGVECIAWTAFNQGETKNFNARVALRTTPANISMNLFDAGVSQTLSAATHSISNVPVSSASKTFAYQQNRGKYKVTYRIERT
jgi:hypothetical protein